MFEYLIESLFDNNFKISQELYQFIPGLFTLRLLHRNKLYFEVDSANLNDLRDKMINYTYISKLP